LFYVLASRLVPLPAASDDRFTYAVTVGMTALLILLIGASTWAFFQVMAHIAEKLTSIDESLRK
jgi:hypothetical protein